MSAERRGGYVSSLARNTRVPARAGTCPPFLGEIFGDHPEAALLGSPEPVPQYNDRSGKLGWEEEPPAAGASHRAEFHQFSSSAAPVSAVGHAECLFSLFFVLHFLQGNADFSISVHLHTWLMMLILLIIL